MRRERRKRNNFYNQNINKKMEKEQFKNDGYQKQLRITLGEDGQIYLQNGEFTQLEYIGLLSTLLINEIQEHKSFQNEFLEKEMD
jgi:hypothetical protein